MISTSYPENEQDWRGRFIANLAAALARREDITLLLWTPPGELPIGVTVATTSNDTRWLEKLSERGGIAHLLRTHKVLAAGTVIQLLMRLAQCYRHQRADVCHVNWLQNALPLLGTRTPALITVLGSDFGLLRLPGMKMLLRAVFCHRRVILAPNAQWMAAELEQIFGDFAEIQTIPFGVDASWFSIVRQAPVNTQKWLVVTRITKNKIGDMFTWGEGLFSKSRQLHLFGPMQERVALPDWVQYHGTTYPEELQRTWFPQATGLITLSLHDEGKPQVMLEAMAAGLPVIASDLPAHRDIIEHQKNGWIAISPSDFRRGLEWLEDSQRNLEIGEAARAWTRCYVGTWEDCAGKYVSAYRRLIGYG